MPASELLIDVPYSLFPSPLTLITNSLFTFPAHRPFRSVITIPNLSCIINPISFVLFLTILSTLLTASSRVSPSHISNSNLYLLNSTATTAQYSTCANFFPRHARSPAEKGINAPFLGCKTTGALDSARSFGVENFWRNEDVLVGSQREGSKAVTSGPQYMPER